MPSKWAKYRARLHRWQNGQCRACGNGYSAKWMQIDHILPRSEGGGNDLSNLQLLCPSCHTLKTRVDAARRAGRPVIGPDGLPR